jgi:hypothetical protein
MLIAVLGESVTARVMGNYIGGADQSTPRPPPRRRCDGCGASISRYAAATDRRCYPCSDGVEEAPVRRERGSVPDAILPLLAVSPRTARQLTDATGLPHSSVKAALRILLTGGRVKRTGDPRAATPIH